MTTRINTLTEEVSNLHTAVSRLSKRQDILNNNFEWLRRQCDALNYNKPSAEESIIAGRRHVTAAKALLEKCLDEMAEAAEADDDEEEEDEDDY